MATTARSLFLGGYILFPGNHYAGAWRHPYSTRDFNDRRVFEDVARTLEAAKFDMAFIPETLHHTTDIARYGLLNGLKHDPTQLASVFAGVTRNLGLGITLSASYTSPYHLARELGTLDLLSGGRVAWNIVMTAPGPTAANFPQVPSLTRSELYDRGDEVVEATVALWNSWAEDALVNDPDSASYVDTDLVTTPDYHGRYVDVRGPLTLPRSPQGHPVLIQAGDSPRGREFGGRWADLIFAIERTEQALRAKRQSVREYAALAGRDPEAVRLVAAVQPIIGETTSIARERQEYLRTLILPAAAVAMLSMFTRVDLASFDQSSPLADALATAPTPARRISDELTALSAGRTLSVRDGALLFATSELTPQIVGTPAEVADQLAALYESEAVDGYIISPTHFPGAFDEFARSVVPELQRRGIFRTEYDDTTLRGNLFGTRTPRVVPAQQVSRTPENADTDTLREPALAAGVPS